MKQEIPQNVIAGIAIVVVLAILIFGYTKFVKGPSEISPEETRKMMNGAQGAEASHGK